MPALLAAAAAGVAVGLPAPRRDVVGGSARRLSLPPPVFPVLAALGALVLTGPVAALVTAFSVVAGQRAVQRRRSHQALRAERAAAAEALGVMAAELRAGRVPTEALSAAAEVALGGTRSVLAAAATATGFGADPTDSWLRDAHTCAVPEMLRGLAACWRVCAGTGSSLALAVDRLEEALRAELRQRDLVETETAAASATALLLAGLPAMGLLLAQLTGADPLHVLLHTPVGALCLVAGIGLDLLGLWWTRRLVASAARGA